MKISVEIDTEKEQDLETIRELVEILKEFLSWLKNYGDYGQNL